MCTSFVICSQLLSLCNGTPNEKVRPENTAHMHVNINIHQTYSLITGSDGNVDAFHCILCCTVSQL